MAGENMPEDGRIQPERRPEEGQPQMQPEQQSRPQGTPPAQSHPHGANAVPPHPYGAQPDRPWQQGQQPQMQTQQAPQSWQQGQQPRPHGAQFRQPYGTPPGQQPLHPQGPQFQQPPYPYGAPPVQQPQHGAPFARPWPHGAQAAPQSYQQPPQQGELQPDGSVRYRVHHSYIWLGGLRAIAGILVAGLIVCIGNIAEFFSEIQSGTDQGFGVFIGVAATAAVFLLIAIGIFVYQAISYRYLHYEIGDEEFTLYSGILNKKRVHVPYRRVQSVDERATLLQRIFGVCTVNIDTAGGSSNKAITVPYVQRTQADYLRAELFARKQRALVGDHAASAAAKAAPSVGVPAPQPSSFGGAALHPSGAPYGTSNPAAPAGFAASATAAPGVSAEGNILDVPAELWHEIPTVFGGAGYADGVVTCEYGLSNKELVLTGISNSAGFAVIVIGLLATIGQVAETALPLMLGVDANALEGVAATSIRLFGGNIIAFGIATAATVVLVLWALSVLATCVSFGGFRARRRASRIEVERGLLQHRFQGVDVDKVQAVIVKQGVIRRLFGYCELSLGKIDAGAEDQSNQQMSMTGVVIHPFVKMIRVPEILSGMLPEFADVPIELTPLPKVALRRGIIRRAILQGAGFWFAVIVTIAFLILTWVLSDPSISREAFGTTPGAGPSLAMYAAIGAGVCYALCAVIFVLEIVSAVLWFRNSGFAYNDRFMSVRNGGLACETVSFPRRKIQFGFTRTNPLQRHAGTATVNARTAAGVGGTTVKLIDVDAAAADAWLAWMEPRRK